MNRRQLLTWLSVAALLLMAAGCPGPHRHLPSGAPSILDQDDPYAHVAVAKKYLHEFFASDDHPVGNIYAAIEACETALGLKPGMAEAHYLIGYAKAIKGMVLQRERIVNEGLDHYRQSIVSKPSLKSTGFLAPLQFLVADKVLSGPDVKVQDVREAVALLQEGIRVDPDNVPAHLSLSGAYYQMGNFDLSLHEAKIAVELAPNSAQPQKQLGQLYTDIAMERDGRRRLPAARKGIEAMKKAVRLDPDDAFLHESLGVLYGVVGQYELKAFSLATAIELEDTSSSQIEMAGAYLARGNIDKAMQHARAALDIDKDNAVALMSLALCHYLKNDFDRARKILSGYIKTADTVYAYEALLYYHMLLGCEKRKDAETFIRKFHRKFQGEAWEKALLEYHVGQRTVEGLLAAAANRFDHCEAYYYIGCRRWHSGDPESAREWFEKASRTRSYDFYEYILARIRLAQLAGQ